MASLDSVISPAFHKKTLALFIAAATLAGCGSDNDKKDDPKPAPVNKSVVSVTDISIPEGSEGQSQAIFTVKLDNAASDEVAVTFDIAAGTATEGDDYQKPAATELKFAAGDSEKTIAVNVTADTQYEADETFTLTLASVSGNAELGADRSAQATIKNDDFTLNDTGVTFAANTTESKDDNCADTSDNVIAQQDCKHGLDSNDDFNDNANGPAGFNFTKLDAEGKDLAADATSWNCVRDNVTGLIWEVKSGTGIRAKEHAYLSYQQRFAGTETPDDIVAGVEDSGAGKGSDDCGNANKICTTEQFAADVNAEALCGFNDWRLPRVNELESILNYASAIPAVNADYFPNHISTWTDTPSRGGASNGSTLYLNAETGLFALQAKEYDLTADNAPKIGTRLVRGGKATLATGADLTRSVTASATSPAINCEPNLAATAPVADFEFNIDGNPALVRHKSSGLTWQRCPEGSNFNDAGTADDYSDDLCDGTVNFGQMIVNGFATWDSALKAGEDKGNGWRLPNIRELQSIVEHACTPAQNALVFPPYIAYATHTWSSTPALDSSGNLTQWYFTEIQAQRGLATRKVKTGPAGGAPAPVQGLVRLVRDAD